MSEKALGRALDVLQVFAQARQPLSMSALAVRVGMPAASCARLLRALQSIGLLRMLDGASPSRSYYPTGRLAALAEGIADFNPWTRLLHSDLERLRDESGETVVFGMLWHGGVRALAVLESRQAIRYSVEAGAPRPLHANAIGKALLGAMPAKRRAELVGQIRYERFTPYTLMNAGALLADIERGLAAGWQTNDAESQIGVTALAVPMRLPDENYGIALVGPQGRVRPRIAPLGKLLRSMARRMQSQARKS